MTEVTQDRSTFQEKYGPWALVTGASSGIGAEFARQIAANGINVAVAARRKERLESLAQELEREYGVSTRTIPVDLTAPDALDVIEAATGDLDIGLLVNNAGTGVPGAFLKRRLEERSRVVQLNVAIPMQLAYVFGQKLSKRGRGGIIFLSSLSGYVGSPYLANYAATKAYLLNLGQALNVELKPQGVDVLVLSPGPTRTEFAHVYGLDTNKMPVTWMTPEAVARSGLQALGRTSAIIPGCINKMMNFIMTHLMPRRLALTMFGNMMAKAMDPGIL